MTLREAATEVLAQRTEPMRTCDIWNAIRERGFYKGKGLTPYRTLTAVLTLDISGYGSKSTFVRHGFGLYGLRNPPHRARETATRIRSQ